MFLFLTNHCKHVRVIHAAVSLVVARLFPVKHHRAGKAKIGAEGVDYHGPTHICRLEQVNIEGVVSRVEDDLQKGDDQELEGAGLP